MKRVKAMLAGIAVIAVIGGAFAFKAKNAFAAHIYTSTLTNGAGGCTINNLASTFGSPSPTGVYYTTAAAAVAGNACYTTKVALAVNP